MKVELKKFSSALTAAIVSSWPLLAYFYGVEEKQLDKERNQISAAILKVISNPEIRKDSKSSQKAMQGALRRYLNQELSKAQKAGPHDSAAYLKIAKVFYLMENHARSLEVLSLGVTENPEAVSLWMMIGALEVEAGRDQEALAVFKRAAQLDPANGRALNDLAHLSSKGSKKFPPKLKIALQYANKALSLEPNNPYYMETVAKIHFRLGNKDHARMLIDKALKIAPKETYFQRQKLRFSSNKP